MIYYSNKYLKFVINAVILIFIIGFTDQIIGRVIRHFYFKQESGLYYRTTYAVDSTTAEILVFGSSRANHHYVPEIFEGKLNQNFYNCGRDGSSLLYSSAVFKAVTIRYTPKILIFDINPDELNYEKTEYDRLSSLLPYYKKHHEIRSIVELKSSFEKYKLVSEIYPFNSTLLTIAIGNMEFNKARKNDRKGYVPLTDNIRDTVLHKIKLVDGIPDTNKVKFINEIIRYCNANNIRLIFIQSPMFAILQNYRSTDIVEKLAGENKIVFWDLINDPEFLNKPEYFQDQDHLNDMGANYFSKLIVQKIKDLQTDHQQALKSAKEF